MKSRAHRAVDAESAAERRALKLGFLIHDTARLRRLAFDAALRPLGYTSAQASVLRHLSSEHGLTQSELAARLDLGKVALGETVARLEAAGLLERRGDEGDRRLKRLHLTTAGRRAIAKLRTLAVALNEGILAGVDAADVDTAFRILAAIKANLLAVSRAQDRSGT
ncbi:MAG: MarR family transcriptional regulator [Gammaproteobacteria bacterium]|nr:MarR family transcriptional regulator [Gammaproteobacteria bacterium]MBI5616819.1 MarR family transcriptional regulator [Gammaproteobacteria bacterium]